ncbi:AlpA family transcriptional regulator [Polynucleobacter sp. JS-Polo-80-F4]|jgi:predicted DNA-binding transcriptional regulator AlpA|uniref:helix-turn-helix transcriptional regulator n=1 Tax=Polynucleobacter sp. JS-Polo-80-F4 TaxID=2576918 RepID=UPI001C0BC397|nr:AlpA family phage regulatory protein [Polynucleobacter sp. JS-Polo-80-F4]MBU3617336.1 AlpA family phage regulatory protein [Polynucleobacter sp. JS-Polo-80-F4]
MSNEISFNNRRFQVDSNQGFIRQKRLLGILGFSAPTLWRKVKAGTFPKPIKLGANMTAWRVEEVHQWMNGLN